MKLLVILFTLCCAIGLASTSVAQSPPTPPQIANCDIFPADHIWNVPIDNLPVHAMSEAWVEAIGADETLHPDFGSGLWDGGPIGIPLTVVDGNQPMVDIDFVADWGEEESDLGPYPIPADALIEGGEDSDGDRHVLVIESENCILYELYNAWPQADGSWEADSGAVYDLKGYGLRPAEWTSADAAGLPILPGLVRFEEVEAGQINHALRFTAPETQRAFIWPARHYASDIEDEDYPPMGARFRLKADVDISDYPPDVQVILQAMQTYGLILADNGSPWFITGAPNEGWDNDSLHEINGITGADFEAVDASSLMIDEDSGQASIEP